MLNLQRRASMEPNRNFVKILKEICSEENIEVKSYSKDWIHRLTKNNVNRHIWGYRFELNNASVDHICTDKSALSYVLRDSGVDCVMHEFFMSSPNLQYIDSQGNWEQLLAYFDTHKKVVCKPNEGKGGDSVYIVTSRKELEAAVHKVFLESNGLTICPYYEIKTEYRVIMFDGQVKLIFAKQIPSVVGNGKDTVLELLIESGINYEKLKFDKSMDFDIVLEDGEELKLSTQHNLRKRSYSRRSYR